MYMQKCQVVYFRMDKNLSIYKAYCVTLQFSDILSSLLFVYFTVHLFK